MKRERVPHDHYVEPHWASRVIFARERPRGLVWDPFAGWGRIPEVARDMGHDAYGTDLINRPGAQLDGTMNFLEQRRPPFSGGDFSIYSNPAFSLTPETVRHALSMDPVKLVLFQYFSFYESGERDALFVEMPPARVYVFALRPSCPPGNKLDEIKDAGGSKAAGCFVWTHDQLAGVPPALLRFTAAMIEPERITAWRKILDGTYTAGVTDLVLETTYRRAKHAGLKPEMPAHMRSPEPPPERTDAEPESDDDAPILAAIAGARAA